MNNQIYKYSFSIIRYKVAFEYLSSQIVAITIILTSVYITFHMYSRKAEENAISGSSSEKEVENYNSDISSIANYIRTLQQNRIANIKEINEEQAREVRYLGQNKASMDKVQIQNGVNIANTIQSFTGEETIERDIESLEGRELDIIAEIDRSESSTEQIRKMCQDEEKQFYSDMEKIQVICQDLFNLNKKVQSSDELRTYIRQFTITLSQTLMQNFENEKNARKHYMEYIVFYENIETPLKHSITEIQRNINNIYNDYKQMKKRFQSNFSSVNFFLSEINQYLIHYRDLYEKIHNEEEKKEHSHLISVLSSLEKEFNETCKLFEENYKKLTLLIKNLNSLLLIFQKNIKLLKQYELNIRNNLGKLTTNLSQLTIINYTSPYLNSVLYEFLSNIQNELKKHFSDFSDMFQKDNELFLLIEQMDDKGQRALVVQTKNNNWIQLKAFKGKGFKEGTTDYTTKTNMMQRLYLHVASNRIIESMGYTNLKKYTIGYNDTTQTIFYHQYNKTATNNMLKIVAVWKNKLFMIDDYYLGEHIDDKPLPYPSDEPF